jgi:hypothetical protein
MSEETLEAIDFDCITHAAHELVPELEAIVADLKAGKFNKALSDSKQIIAHAVDKVKQCKEDKEIDIDVKCLVKAVKKLSSDVSKITTDY